MKKIIQIFVCSGLLLCLLGGACWFSVRAISIHKATDKADEIITTVKSKHQSLSRDKEVIEITRTVYQSFQKNNPSNVLLLKLRPYLTNKRLPSFVRLPAGVIETNIEEGLCDNASRMLSFILRRAGFESVQWNMVSNTGGHSALLVKVAQGREVLVDPFFGLAALGKDKQLIHPQKAQGLIRAGRNIDDVVFSLEETADKRFYSSFANMSMAAEGQDLILEATIPNLNKASFILGKIDGKERDVKSASRKAEMMPYWYYIGHKYNREWVRVLKAKEPVKIVMTLVEKPDSGVMTARPNPLVKGKELTWYLEKDEEITFRDGDAKISLKRMNSYINVDQIAFIPMN